MPKLEEALYGYLTTDPDVTGLVGDRIYPLRLKEGTVLPAVAWQRISAQRTYTHDPFLDTAAWVTARMQFSCWDVNPTTAIETGEAVLRALSGYTGVMGDAYIGSAMAEFEMDDYEADTRLYRRLLDVRITYEDDVTGS